MVQSFCGLHVRDIVKIFVLARLSSNPNPDPPKLGIPECGNEEAIFLSSSSNALKKPKVDELLLHVSQPFVVVDATIRTDRSIITVMLPDPHLFALVVRD